LFNRLGPLEKAIIGTGGAVIILCLIFGMFFYEYDPRNPTPIWKLLGDSGWKPSSPPVSPPTSSPVYTPTPTVTPISNSVPPLSSPVIQYQNPLKYDGEYTFELLFNEYNKVNSLSVYIPTPTEWDSQKNVTLIAHSPDGNISSDKNYGKYIYFDRNDLINNALSTKQEFTFVVYEITTNTKVENVVEYNNESPLFIEYTKHENKIEKNYFVDKIQVIVGDEENPIKRARRIYDYVIDSVSYESQGGVLQGAKYCYENKEGECGDSSALFIAMCRAAGIPARPVVGFWADPAYGSAHVWAEFYVQDIGWIPVDPTIGQQSKEKREYYFGNMDNKRLIMSKAYNIQFEDGIADLFQIGAYFWFGTGEHPSLSFHYTRK
jgi:hypothetical protein